MARFVKVPYALTTDATIKPDARALWMFLAGEAWKLGRRSEDDQVMLGSKADLAARFGVSASTYNRLLDELDAAGWVTTARSQRGLVYRLHETRSDMSAGTDSRAGASKSKAVELEESAQASPSLAMDTTETPPVERKRNVLFDALVEHTTSDAGIHGKLIGRQIKLIRSSAVYEAILERTADQHEADARFADGVPLLVAAYRRKYPELGKPSAPALVNNLPALVDMVREEREQAQERGDIRAWGNKQRREQ